MRPEIQAETLDAFAGTTALREEFEKRLAEARALRTRLQEALGSSRERTQRVDFLRYQVAEIERLGLEPGEPARLEEEHTMLANLDRLREGLDQALGLLQDQEPAAVDLLGRAERAIADLSTVDARLEPAAELLADASARLAEAARMLQSRMSDLDLDPGRLAVVEERLAAVRRALARFGPTEEDLRRELDAQRAELAQLTGGDDDARALGARVEEAFGEAASVGRKLLRARRKAAPAFSAAIEAELAALGMPHTRLTVDLPDDVDAAGLATPSSAPAAVDFLVRINPGEPQKSMRETASGGEAARIVLAVKKCLADQDRVPFVAFDEIDAEIGGRLGLAVGKKLAEVARDHQVLIVTHLPQVAAFADAHFKVHKQVAGGRTRTAVELLDSQARELELAAMAAGEGADAAAVAEARRLVARVRSETATAE
jgi:DNA repair protein RecN (Recombination protein N)